MKAEQITSQMLDEIVESHFDNLEGHARIYPLIKTDDIAQELWKRYRVPIWKQVEIVRQKMRDWWAKKPHYSEPRPHQRVGKYAVYLASPMRKTYCVIDKQGNRALIIAYPYQDQTKFFIDSDSKRMK